METQSKKLCESCGMPMIQPGDFGAGDQDNKYCVHCTDKEGKLKPREEVRGGMIKYFMSVKQKPEGEAIRFVDEWMKKMPAWKTK